LESQPRVTTAIRTAVTTVLTEAAAEFPAMSPRLRDLEQQRLESLLVSWIALERQRAPFHVIATEQKSHININGLELDVKADRVDEVEGFGRMIVDYKTGIVGRKPWEGDRPAEPQLPLYACTADQPPAGIAFALLKAGKLAYQGVATQRDLFPKAAVVDDWDQMLGTWRGVLEQLATGILSGDARVAPNRGACDECDASPLCRIKEAPRAARS
jgi:RecB family exonuclease